MKSISSLVDSGRANIQSILDHEVLKSTMLYTRVSLGKLKEIHARFHPGRIFKEKKVPERAGVYGRG